MNKDKLDIDVEPGLCSFLDTLQAETVGKKVIQSINLSIAEGLQVNWEKLDELISSDVLTYPRMRVIKKGDLYSRAYAGLMSINSSENGDLISRVRIPRLVYALTDGCTLIIDRCEAYFPAVKDACSILGRKFNCHVSANLYVSWTDIPGFGMHYDDHDVIAIQISGAKQWECYRPTVLDPMEFQKSFKITGPTGTPLETIRLEPGGCIYVPRGFWHNVTVTDGPSLHVSFAIPRPRMFDFATYILESLLRDPLFRKSPYQCPDIADVKEMQNKVLRVFKSPNFSDYANEYFSRSSDQETRLNLRALMEKQNG